MAKGGTDWWNRGPQYYSLVRSGDKFQKHPQLHTVPPKATIIICIYFYFLCILYNSNYGHLNFVLTVNGGEERVDEVLVKVFVLTHLVDTGPLGISHLLTNTLRCLILPCQVTPTKLEERDRFTVQLLMGSCTYMYMHVRTCTWNQNNGSHN